MRTRILVADDHGLIRRGIRTLLSVDPDLDVVAEASDGMQAVALAEKHLPDIAVIDISMKALNGIDTILQVVQRSPRTSVVVLSMFCDERYVNRAVRAGAKAYVLKDSSDEDLLRAIRALQAGQTFFSPEVAKILLDVYARSLEHGTVADWHQMLTPRERQVYQMLAEGKTNKVIAGQLGVSIHTVETHRIRIMSKLDLHNMADLVLSAVRHGIVK
jgi:two-component system, NarL family, response regulator NreC